MKINGLTNTGNTAATGNSRPSVTRSAGLQTSAGAADEVHLSSASAALAAAGGEPSVDSAKVQEIRQAIAEGRFQINASAIADRLIETARELVTGQRKD